jgi:hypothetical protein
MKIIQSALLTLSLVACGIACVAAEVVNINAGDYNITLVIPFEVDNVTTYEPVTGETYGGTEYISYSASVRPAIMYEEFSPNWTGESRQGENVDVDVVVYAHWMEATEKNLREAAKETGSGVCVTYFDRAFAGIPGVLGVNEWTISDLLGGTIDCTRYKAVWWPDYDEGAATGTVRCTISTQSRWEFTRIILNSVRVEPNPFYHL